MYIYIYYIYTCIYSKPTIWIHLDAWNQGLSPPFAAAEGVGFAARRCFVSRPAPIWLPLLREKNGWCVVKGRPSIPKWASNYMGGIIPKWEVYGGTTASGWWLTYHLEKYMKVKWDDDIPNIWKNKKCSKPPTRHYISLCDMTWYDMIVYVSFCYDSLRTSQ